MKKTERLKYILIPEKRLRDVLELYPGKTRDEVRKLLFSGLGPRLLAGGCVAALLLVLAFFSDRTVQEEPGIKRYSYSWKRNGKVFRWKLLRGNTKKNR